jgi:energy-coupling factor transport system substrate-specific component
MRSAISSTRCRCRFRGSGEAENQPRTCCHKAFSYGLSYLIDRVRSNTGHKLPEVSITGSAQETGVSAAALPLTGTGVAPGPTGLSSHELRAMWRNTRMVVLCVLSAALYAAVLIPFKVLPLIPGVTEVRPGNAIPVVCSFLFGPAAAWGSAIGNMIGDFFGGVGPGDVFGFFGNLAYGYIPYKLWAIIAPGDQGPTNFSPVTIARYTACCLSGSILCADVVGWGDNMLSLRPFWILGNVIIFNNMVASIVLAPLILAAVYPRVRAARLLYRDVMPELRERPRLLRMLGAFMLIVGEIGAWVAGTLLSTGHWKPHFLPASFLVGSFDKAIATVVSPFILFAFAGMMLL